MEKEGVDAEEKALRYVAKAGTVLCEILSAFWISVLRFIWEKD